jgi:transcriptional regulator with XRE-family HTH domain
MNSSVGQQLRSAREKLGISLDDAAHETHIRLNYLQELEDDHPEMLHSAAQARGFLRLYADFLKLPYTDLLSLWDKMAADELPAVEAKPENGAVTWLKKMIPARETKEETEEPALGKAEQPQVESAVVPVEPSQEATTEESSQEDSSLEAVPSEEEKTPIEETSEKEETKSIFTGASGEKPVEEETQKLAAEPAEEPKFLVSLRRFLTDLGARVSHLPVFARLRKPSEEVEGESTSAAAVSARSSVDLFCQIGLLLQNRRKMMDLSLAISRISPTSNVLFWWLWKKAASVICLPRYRGAACSTITPNSWAWKRPALWSCMPGLYSSSVRNVYNRCANRPNLPLRSR